MFQVGRVAVSPIGRISPESFDPRRNSAFELICQLEKERERESFIFRLIEWGRGITFIYILESIVRIKGGKRGVD